MQAPRNIKQLQQFTGRIATLNQFISRSTNKCLHFLKILRKAFEWSEECEHAFDQLKKYLASPPLLSRTVPAIRVALFMEEGGVQKLVYFINQALRGAEERYVQMEKLSFALTNASRKLWPYFQAHTIRVLIEYPLKKVI